MIILRVKTDDGVSTFTFKEIGSAKKATHYIMKTTAAGFIAEAKSADSMSGRILDKWDNGLKFMDKTSRRLSYDIQSGAYKDTKWAILGTEEECIRMAEETNDKATCWASVTCHVEHLVGPLYQCVYCDPYKD